MMAQVLMNKEGADQESFCSDYDDAVTSDSDTVAADSNGVPSPHHPCYSGGSTRHAVWTQTVEMAERLLLEPIFRQL